jgi:UDP-N-acetylmuramoyl-tripeptide--D-alanyl-D-alanine ligase
MKIYLREVKERFPEFEIRNYDENAFFIGFNHDSRTIKQNELFIPIVGEKFDGHDFILQSLQGGASISLCEAKKSLLIKDATKPIILVDTIEEGLQKLLNFSISSITAPIIAITGSTGKTTTRQMLSTILSEDGKVLTADNANTVWGNANLLSQYVDEKYIALECGMDRAGEIAWHVNSVDPDLGILLNVGDVHAEKLGSIENIYQEKKNLADYLNKTGKPLILNVDDDRLIRILKDSKAEIITFGKNEYANYKISDVIVGQEGTDFVLTVEMDSHNIHLNTFGDGLVYDAVAAIAAANRLGLSMEMCINGIKKFVPNKGRFEIVKLKDGNIVINDAYNANPASMDMSLRTFSTLYPQEEYYRIVVLGDMKELGDVASEKHKVIGELAKALDFNEVYFLGEYFKDFNYGIEVKSIEEIASKLKLEMNKVTQKVAILCKGSHSTQLFEVPALLQQS